MTKAKQRKSKYSGVLGKRGELYRIFALRAQIEGTENSELKQQASELYERVVELLMDELLRHYQIPGDQEDRWQTLSFRLACDHVDAFDTRPLATRGRPRKMLAPRIHNRLSALYFGEPSKQRGRPKDAERKEWRRTLLIRAVEICRARGFKGRGAIAQYVAWELDDLAKTQGVRRSSLKEYYVAWQKDISRAKKEFPEIAGKLPA